MKLAIFQKISDPGYAKKFKKEFFEKRKFIPKKFGQFFEKWLIGYAKKFKKRQSFKKNLFCSKQPKKPLNMFQTLFV